MTGAVVFWGMALLVFYAYLGYPALLWVLARFRPRPVRSAPLFPRVTLIISAYNEEKNIGRKLENALDTAYPADRLDIVVVSDASSDGTEAVARRYEARGVRTVRIEGRLGKTACLNRVVPEVRGEILLFSDANALHERRSLERMTRHFADPAVGFVTGHTRYVSASDRDDAHETVSLYARLERVTKSLESRIGSCIGADGAIFAIRRELYAPLREEDINDLVIPLQIVSRGYRGILEPEAFCEETSGGGSQGEYRRQVRITNRTLRAIFRHRHLFDIRRFGLISFQLFSHKLAKYLVPLALIGLLVSNLFLVGRGALYAVLLACQLLFYGAALGRGTSRALPAPARRAVDFAGSFVTVNLAMLQGWVTWLRGKTFVTWRQQR